MMRLSRAVAAVPPSGIRQFFDVVSQMEDVISLGVGEPDFGTAWRVREAAIYGLERGVRPIPPTAACSISAPPSLHPWPTAMVCSTTRRMSPHHCWRQRRTRPGITGAARSRRRGSRS